MPSGFPVDNLRDAPPGRRVVNRAPASGPAQPARSGRSPGPARRPGDHRGRDSAPPRTAVRLGDTDGARTCTWTCYADMDLYVGVDVDVDVDSAHT
ncbi:hypothetical protein SSP531S_12220 [Streptomyces spongiicola]|uniref:Uncharacterized protein n=1 Tax=Streptomyces spongiicola TaxID=1690221 RepID=A0A388SXV2_9ACTN|nr:hypothetical protein SSP531S_12220 [Streptomyces spongiicola]